MLSPLSVGGAVVPWPACYPPNQVVWDPALAEDIVICSWNLMLGVTLQWSGIPSREGGGVGRGTPTMLNKISETSGPTAPISIMLK